VRLIKEFKPLSAPTIIKKAPLEHLATRNIDYTTTKQISVSSKILLYIR
jgi:hypothetical protein